VPAGVARNHAPGRLRASSRPALRPVCEVLAALASGRVLPFAPDGSRKRGPKLSRGVKALARPAVERREASGSRWGRSRARRCGSCKVRLSALRLPSLFFPFVAFRNRLPELGRIKPRRENGLSLRAPAKPAGSSLRREYKRKERSFAQIELSGPADDRRVARIAGTEATRSDSARAMRSARLVPALHQQTLPPCAFMFGRCTCVCRQALEADEEQTQDTAPWDRAAG
jgi:hypothetical protein